MDVAPAPLGVAVAVDAVVVRGGGIGARAVGPRGRARALVASGAADAVGRVARPDVAPALAEGALVQAVRGTARAVALFAIVLAARVRVAPVEAASATSVQVVARRAAGAEIVRTGVVVTPRGTVGARGDLIADRAGAAASRVVNARVLVAPALAHGVGHASRHSNEKEREAAQKKFSGSSPSFNT